MDGNVSVPNFNSFNTASFSTSETPLSSLAPGDNQKDWRQTFEFARIDVSGEEEAGPLSEIGITPVEPTKVNADITSDESIRPNGTVNYLHPNHIRSEALWAYLVIIIIIVIAVVILIKNSKVE